MNRPVGKLLPTEFGAPTKRRFVLRCVLIIRKILIKALAYVFSLFSMLEILLTIFGLQYDIIAYWKSIATVYDATAFTLKQLDYAADAGIDVFNGSALRDLFRNQKFQSKPLINA